MTTTPREDLLPAPYSLAGELLPNYETRRRRRRRNRRRTTIEWAVLAAVALVIAVVVRTVVFQSFYIPSASMVPTLRVGDRILVNKLAYEYGSIERGDIVVFTRPPAMADRAIQDLVKRVVGLPGETLDVAHGQITVNGKPLDEHYVNSVCDPASITAGLRRIVVPRNSIFVMGDNRCDSMDSRVFGPIKVSSVVGRAFVRYWPVSRVGLP